LQWYGGSVIHVAGKVRVPSPTLSRSTDSEVRRPEVTKLAVHGGNAS
jgi:hypothetical protein